MNVKEVIVRCTDGAVMRGKVNIGDKMSRVSDWISGNREDFITVFDATSDEEVGKVIVVNKSHIIWVVPVNE